MYEKIEKELQKLMKKAMKKNEVPIASILVQNNKIISKTFNTREKYNNVLNHAEIICILKASKKIKRWNMSDCTLYVTLEPCGMCKKIIEQAKINKVYYYVKKPEKKKEYSKTIYQKIENDFLEKTIKENLNNFFKSKRKTNVRIKK